MVTKSREERVVAVDVETTGLSPWSDRIIEIGAVAIRSLELCEGESFRSLVNPGIPVPRAVEGVHGIDDDMLQDAPSMDIVLPGFIAFLGDSPIVAHSAHFDIGFLQEAANRLGTSWRPPKIYDTVTMFKKAFPHVGERNLDTVCRKLGIVPEGRHRGLGDALLAAKVFIALKRCLETA